MTNQDVGFVLIVLVLAVILLPCRYDPAIRMREWLDRMDTEGPDDY
jgi:hypothetical protein